MDHDTFAKHRARSILRIRTRMAELGYPIGDASDAEILAVVQRIAPAARDVLGDPKPGDAEAVEKLRQEFPEAFT